MKINLLKNSLQFIPETEAETYQIDKLHEDALVFDIPVETVEIDHLKEGLIFKINFEDTSNENNSN